TFTACERGQTFRWELPARPLAVAIDPAARILSTGKISTPSQRFRGALRRAQRPEHAVARGRLPPAASRDARPQTVERLAEVLRSDAFWGVQGEAALALARIRPPAALSALLGARPVYPKARRLWAQALGEFRDPAAGAALSDLARRGDPSYLVQREEIGRAHV